MAVHLRRQTQTVMVATEPLHPCLEQQLPMLVEVVGVAITVAVRVLAVLAEAVLVLWAGLHLCLLLLVQQILVAVAAAVAKLADTALLAATVAPAL